MDTLADSSPTYMDNYHSMHVSHDADTSDPKDLCSLGVVDLDLSLSPDVFSLWAFDISKPLTRMLPGSFPCELRLCCRTHILPQGVFMMSSLKTWPRLLPGVHSISPPGMLLHSADDGRRLYFGLCDGGRRRWSGSVVLFARCLPEWAFCHNKPGFCLVCQEQITSTLDVHMINVHLKLGQLWQCPVEWCTVWKGSVSDCLGHLQDKHGGSQYVAMGNIAKFFPPWTVPRGLWMTALRPDVSGIVVVPFGTQV